MSVLPSPSKSAGTILSVGVPNDVTVNPSRVLSTYHAPSFARYWAMSAILSPSKSNGTPGVPTGVGVGVMVGVGVGVIVGVGVGVIVGVGVGVGVGVRV